MGETSELKYIVNSALEVDALDLRYDAAFRNQTVLVKGDCGRNRGKYRTF